MFVKGNTIGVLELIDKVNKDTWKVKCTKCGKESFKKLSSLYWITKHPTNYCQECIKEVQKPIEPGEVIGTIEVLEKLSNEKFKVKCNNCGRVYQLCSTTISTMRNKPPKFCSKCKDLSGIHTKYKEGDIIGNCYRLISLNKGNYWNVECTQCGKKLLLSIPNMKNTNQINVTIVIIPMD